MEDNLVKPFIIVSTLKDTDPRVKDSKIESENANEKKPPKDSELLNPPCLSLTVQTKGTKDWPQTKLIIL